MKNLSAFPKIFSLGTIYIKDIFDSVVEITEKVDGSQFVFGKKDGQIYMRSKGAELYVESYNKMFKEAVEYVQSIKDKIQEGYTYYCEYLQKPRHNVLKYERVPKNNLILFGFEINGAFEFGELVKRADEIGIESVPVLRVCMVDKDKSLELVKELLNMDSVLGGTKIEGVVVKNYNQTLLIGGQPLPISCGKFVSEAFKEKHDKDWDKEKGKGRWPDYCETLRTEARWLKAIQHLKEKGELKREPCDIGKLLKEINTDLLTEEKENIKEFLWTINSHDAYSAIKRGFPEWYKEWLLKTCDDENK